MRSRGRSAEPDALLSGPGRVRRALADPRELAFSILLVVGVLLGGSIEPMHDLVIEILSVLLFVFAALRFDHVQFQRARLGMFAIAAVLIMAVWQLTPIPHGLWRMLPGRAEFEEIYRAVGVVPAYYSFSLDRSATVATLLKTIPGLACFFVVLAMSPAQQAAKMTLLIWLCLAAAVQGMFQMSGFSGAYIYVIANGNGILGPFGNYNHASDFFLVGATFAVPRIVTTERLYNRGLWLAAWSVLMLCAVLTRSRTGASLTVIPAMFLVVSLAWRSRFRLAILLVSAIAIGITAYVLARYNMNVARVADRFDAMAEDSRFEIWRHSMHLAGQYFPFGSGLGTFFPVFQRGEPIDQIIRAMINRAHNDYVELFLEIGIFAVILAAGYLGALVRQGYTLMKSRNGFATSCILALCVLMLHSLVDYPMRNASLMIIFGTLNGIVFSQLRNKVSPHSS